MRQARFWIWKNHGWVRVKLKQFQTLSHFQSERTDEGWSSVAERFGFDGRKVYSEVQTDGRDCDGRLTVTTLWSCKVDDLKAVHCDIDDVWRPDWKKERSDQRDEFAEAMGY